MRALYEQKASSYFRSARKEILPLLPAGKMRILDLGCGEGATLAWLSGLGRCSESVGIEFFESAADKARSVADRIVVADVETDDISLPAEHFDCILCLDVLEHLRDPWRTLRNMMAWLKPNGTVVVSLPNVRYRKVLFDLAIRGQFDYGRSGILDKTHLRFFTRSGAVSLLESAGLAEVVVIPHPSKVTGMWRILNALSFRYFEDIFPWQYFLSGKKTAGALLAGNS